jgi:signal transduction histidine kinase
LDRTTAAAALADGDGGTLALDTDGVVVAATGGAEVLLERDPAGLRGDCLASLVEAGLVERAAPERYRTALAALRDGGSAPSFRLDVRPAASGPWRPFRVTTVPVRADGALVGTVWHVSALGAEPRYEETVEALHASTRELMAADSVAAALDRCGRAANEVLGFPGTGVRRHDPETGLLHHVSFGGKVGDVRDRPPFPVDDSPHGRAFRTGETVVEEVGPDDRFDRAPFTHVMYVPIGEFGTLSLGRLSGPFTDSDRRFAEILAANTAAALESLRGRERLREREAELERQNERLEAFASVVSHDLRNPLSLVRGAFESYRDTGEERFAEDVAYGLDRADRIVEEVLALAREGKTVAEPDAVDLPTAAEEAWVNVDGDATLATPTGATVRADRERLVRLLTNLFDNSLDHGGADTVAVEVTDGGFAVVDDGSGLPADAEQVFEEGFTTADDGTGFGLAIVRAVARAHGWDVATGDGHVDGARFVVDGVEFVERG